MKHKWVTLVTVQPVIYHENSQYFYPSEPFEKNHITMRHPVTGRASVACCSMPPELNYVVSQLSLLTEKNDDF